MGHLTVYMKLGLTLSEFKSAMEKWYSETGSVYAVAKKLKCSPQSIKNWMHRLNIPFFDIGILRSNRRREVACGKIAVLTKIQLHRLDGLLLGDGHLRPGKYTSRYTHSSKYIQTLERITRIFDCLIFSKPYYYISKIGASWSFASLNHIALKPIRDRWYPDGKKIIPKDIELYPETMYEWYIGDGCCSCGSVYLCTNGFADECRELLRDKLTNLGVTTTVMSDKRIRIRTVAVQKFYSIIGSCLNPEYQYKWALSE